MNLVCCFVLPVVGGIVLASFMVAYFGEGGMAVEDADFIEVDTRKVRGKVERTWECQACLRTVARAGDDKPLFCSECQSGLKE